MLGGKRKEISAKLDQPPAQLFVKTEIMMACQIVPISRAMVHEIDTESRTLPGDYCLKTQAANDSFQAFLHLLSQRFDMPIDFPIIHKQALDCGNGGCGRNRVRIVSTGQQYSLRGVGVDEPIHQLLLAPECCHRVPVSHGLAKHH